jgi:hypothetical protein
MPSLTISSPVVKANVVPFLQDVMRQEDMNFASGISYTLEDEIASGGVLKDD